MRIAFLDLSQLQYTVDTPYSQPLGGSQSAMCYLAAELARLGHDVTIFNGNPTSTESKGVQIRTHAEFQAPGYLNRFDAVVVLNIAFGLLLRRDLQVTAPLVLWNQHAADQESILTLRRPNERDSWTAFAFVSNWQLGEFEKTFEVPREKCRAMRNAVSPAFANNSDVVPWFIAGEPPTLFYTSTPFRGLDVLLQAFPTIRAAIPGTRLRIFSSMQVYQISSEHDQFHDIYNHARSLEGVELLGSVGQTRLAQELSNTAAFAYPSTFPETSCIAALEAMATGAAVLTTALGALPETTGGFASIIESQPDKTKLSENFAGMAIEALRDMQNNHDLASAHRDQRLKFIRENYLWPQRAQEWADWLSHLGRAA